MIKKTAKFYDIDFSLNNFLFWANTLNNNPLGVSIWKRFNRSANEFYGFWFKINSDLYGYILKQIKLA